jgi:hypothetical protein
MTRRTALQALPGPPRALAVDLVCGLHRRQHVRPRALQQRTPHVVARGGLALEPGGYCSPRHRLPLTQETRVQGALDDVVGNAQRAWRIARHVTGCHLTQETRAQNALDDSVSHIREALPRAIRCTLRRRRPGRWSSDSRAATPGARDNSKRIVFLSPTSAAAATAAVPPPPLPPPPTLMMPSHVKSGVTWRRRGWPWGGRDCNRMTWKNISAGPYEAQRGGVMARYRRFPGDS